MAEHIREAYKRLKYRSVSEVAPKGFPGLGSVDVSPMWIDGCDGEFYVNRVFVPARLRGKGMATRLMTRLADEADIDHVTLWIDPTANYGSDVSRLIEFFSRFGFVVVDNFEKGRMCRKPNLCKVGVYSDDEDENV